MVEAFFAVSNYKEELHHDDASEKVKIELSTFCLALHGVVILFCDVAAKKTNIDHSADTVDVFCRNVPDVFQEEY